MLKRIFLLMSCLGILISFNLGKSTKAMAQEMESNAPFVLFSDQVSSDETDQKQGESLALEQAMLMASENNIDLSIQKAFVESTRQDKNKAITAYLPQVNTNITYSRIDKDRSEYSFGSIPYEKVTEGFSVSQLIFDDRTVSAILATGKLWDRQKLEQEVVRLDRIELAGKRFLQYLQSQVLLQVKKDNLKLTRNNLELALLRKRVGTSGPEEVYRWEAQEARDRSAVISAESDVEQARIALNQVLNVPQNQLWNPVDIALAEEDDYFLGNRFFGKIKNEDQVETLEEFVVHFGLQNAPSLLALDRAIEAQQINLSTAKRRFFLPTAHANFSYDYRSDETFAPSSLPAGFPGMDLDDEEWMFAVTLSYPLFEGGGRFVDIKKAEADLERLDQTRTQVMQLIEQRARAALYALYRSQPNIKLSRIAADRAGKEPGSDPG